MELITPTPFINTYILNMALHVIYISVDKLHTRGNVSRPN
jgi:hypothetical protein